MTPPCPNCGTVYHESTVSGKRTITIDTLIVPPSPSDPAAFAGYVYQCSKCRHRWRVLTHPHQSER